AGTVGRVIDDRRAAPDALAVALAIRALVRARRGDRSHVALLDHAIALADDGGDLQRVGPVVCARAEILWLDRRAGGIEAATAAPLELALACEAPWIAGELALWRRRAGVHEDYADGQIAEPHQRSLSDDWTGAARTWDRLGCRYEAALARADSGEQ